MKKSPIYKVSDENDMLCVGRVIKVRCGRSTCLCEISSISEGVLFSGIRYHVNVIYSNCGFPLSKNSMIYHLKTDECFCWFEYNEIKNNRCKLSKLDRLIAIKYKFGVRHIPKKKVKSEKS